MEWGRNIKLLCKRLAEKSLFNLNVCFQVQEKNVLPSANDLKQEKTHEELQQGIAQFEPDKLKSVKTKEPASGADCKHNQKSFTKQQSIIKLWGGSNRIIAVIYIS